MTIVAVDSFSFEKLEFEDPSLVSGVVDPLLSVLLLHDSDLSFFRLKNADVLGLASCLSDSIVCFLLFEETWGNVFFPVQ